MIRKSMFNFGAPAPMQNSMNFQFGQPESEDPLGAFKSNFLMGQGEPTAPATKLESPANKFKATQALMDYVQSAPKREDYQLGKWGKVGAALTAAAAGFNNPSEGIKLGSELRERPYTQAMQDYGAKGQGLQMAAELESNMYGKDLEYQKMFHDWSDKAADNTREDKKVGLTERGIANDENRLTTQQQQWQKDYELNKDKMMQSGWREFTDKDGNMQLINDITKEKRDLGPSIAGSNLAVAKANADSAGMSASAALQNAGTNAVRAANDDKHNTNMETLGSQRNNIAATNAESLKDSREAIDPRDELLMQAAAAKELAVQFPGYAKFVNADGTLSDEIKAGGWMSDDKGITDFTTKLKAKLNEMRTRKRGQKVNDESAVITLPPIPKPGGF